MKNCPYCGKKPIIEHWASGGTMYMVKCNNPDCLHLDMYPTGRDINKVKAEWDERAKQIEGREHDD